MLIEDFFKLVPELKKKKQRNDYVQRSTLTQAYSKADDVDNDSHYTHVRHPCNVLK